MDHQVNATYAETALESLLKFVMTKFKLTEKVARQTVYPFYQLGPAQEDHHLLPTFVNLYTETESLLEAKHVMILMLKTVTVARQLDRQNLITSVKVLLLNAI